MSSTVEELQAEVQRLKDRIAELEKGAALLSALHAAGVDNWEGYDEALEALEDES
ncbi:hypothetical protein [Streptomyces sp. NPDC059538]|uniref:hypothetical protein n=1 Tax=Streptomyces sp. NPDC059538 TaxID=3346860 RepID=UPI0036B1462C